MSHIHFTKVPNNTNDDVLLKRILANVGFLPTDKANSDEDLWQLIATEVISGTQPEDCSWSSWFKAVDKHFNQLHLYLREEDELSLEIKVEINRNRKEVWRHVSIKVWENYFHSENYSLVREFCTPEGGWKIY